MKRLKRSASSLTAHITSPRWTHHLLVRSPTLQVLCDFLHDDKLQVSRRYMKLFTIPPKMTIYNLLIMQLLKLLILQLAGDKKNKQKQTKKNLKYLTVRRYFILLIYLSYYSISSFLNLRIFNFISCLQDVELFCVVTSPFFCIPHL